MNKEIPKPWGTYSSPYRTEQEYPVKTVLNKKKSNKENITEFIVTNIEREYIKGFEEYREAIKLEKEERIVEKKVPINPEEECIINIQELADHLTIKELKGLYMDFTIKNYNKEYLELLEKYISLIKSFSNANKQ